MIVQKPNNETAVMPDDVFCSNCGWPLISACCNDQMQLVHPNYDYWVYCSNQGCQNHEGEAFGQDVTPSFLKRKMQ